MSFKGGIDKFTEDNDFRLSKENMQTILIQQMYTKVLKGEVVLSVTILQENKAKMVDKVRGPMSCISKINS